MGDATWELAPITVLVGHAGVGKTNVALGLALQEAARGRAVTLADLDVVNPYFRSSDYPEVLDEAHVRLIAPVLARSTLDTPSLTGELDAVIADVAANPTSSRLVIDVGGDDDGATTLGRWARPLSEAGADICYCVSAFRALTQEAADAVRILRDVEDHMHLSCTAVLNTSNLGDETTREHVEHGRAFAREVAKLSGLPLKATVVPAVAWTDDLEASEPLVRMERHVRLPWD